jgi:hypothetical protein
MESAAQPPDQNPSLLRQVAGAWLAAACLPLPALLMTSPATNADVSCLYLGLASAWLAVEILRCGGYPSSRAELSAKLATLCIALAINGALFIALGSSVSVRSNIPFALLALFAIIPSLGLVPWMVLKLRNSLTALVLSALVLLVAKLSACVVARLVYGPDYMEHGYVAADWRMAKLMISMTWLLITLISVGMLAGCFRQVQVAQPEVRSKS